MQEAPEGGTGPVFGGGALDTVMHPVVGVAVAIAVVLIIVLPRKLAMYAFVVVAILAPFGQQAYIVGVHFYATRLLFMGGWVRLFKSKLASRAPLFVGGLNSMDKAFLLWALFRAFAVIAYYRGSSASLVNQAGFLIDVLGGYFLIRYLIQDEEDIFSFIKVCAVLVAFLGIAMMFEKVRAENPFGWIGGRLIPDSREGSVRAQGPFGHAILAGTFGATILGLFLLYWKSGRSKLMAGVGIAGATLMVVACASSTPLFAYLAAIVGVCFWPMRKRMRLILRGVTACLITLHLVMKAPVWFLIARVDLIAGNSGYHRARLIDQAIMHFRDWWLFGTDQAVTWGDDMWDLSNQFVAEAETGGLLTFICFMLLIIFCFRRIGKARKLVEGDEQREWFFWLMGVTMFSHMAAFFGIGYWDQIRVPWFAIFAIVTAATVPVFAAQIVTEEVRPKFNMGVSPSRPAAVTSRRSLS
jgi:hypothetical protein